MRTYQYILALVLCTLSLGAWSQDFSRLSERSISGTARYTGMSGAMTAIGGDPSAAQDNPAGLGLYQRSEFMFTGGFRYDRTWHTDALVRQSRRRFELPQTSLVLTFISANPSHSGVQSNSLMFGYRRLQHFNRSMFARTTSADASLGALMASTGANLGIDYCSDAYNTGHDIQLDESGYVDEYTLDWGMNISHRWYVGAGLHIQATSLTADAVYGEDFPYLSADGKTWYNESKTYLHYKGVSCTFAAGLIWRPASWLRLGCSVQTPSLGRVTIYSSGKLLAMTDSLRTSTAPDLKTDVRNMHLPLRVSSSVAFQMGYVGMLAFQYDYSHMRNEQDFHSLRVGLEVIPVVGMYINAGYAYESTFNKQYMTVGIDPTLDRQDAYFQRLRYSQYASVALGYRGNHVMVQAAYQYRWQGLNLYAHENAMPYDMRTSTHRVVLTIGWHRY